MILKGLRVVLNFYVYGVFLLSVDTSNILWVSHRWRPGVSGGFRGDAVDITV